LWIRAHRARIHREHFDRRCITGLRDRQERLLRPPILWSALVVCGLGRGHRPTALDIHGSGGAGTVKELRDGDSHRHRLPGGLLHLQAGPELPVTLAQELLGGCSEL
jgi:hypothetical protein